MYMVEMCRRAGLLWSNGTIIDKGSVDFVEVELVGSRNWISKIGLLETLKQLG